MEPLSEPTNTVWSFPFTPQDWEQTPPAVQAYVRTLRDEVAQLHDRVETLEARLTAEFHDLIQATVIGLALQEASPAHDRQPRPAKRVGNRAIQAIARCSYPLRPCASCGPSGVRVATRRLP